MALKNIVRVYTPTVGNGALTLGGAVQGYKTFIQAGCINGETYTYGIHDFDVAGSLIASEVGRGTYNGIFNTFARTSVLASTNADAALVLTGNAQVFITGIAEDFDHTSGSILHVGTNTHVQIDAHISNVANPHNVTVAQIGAQPVDATLTSISALADAVGYLKNDGAGNLSWSASTTPTNITVANESADTSCFIGFFTAASGDLEPKTNAGLTFNSSNGVLSVTGLGVGVASPLTSLQVNGAIYANQALSDLLGFVDWPGNNSIYNFVGGGGRWGIRTGTAYDINFDVYNGSVVNKKVALKILQGGEIGIGTTSPLALLHLGTGNVDMTFGANNGPNWASNAYYSSEWKYIKGGQAATLFAMNPNGASKGDFGIYTAPSGIANAAITWTCRLTVLENGRTGISIDAPTAKLHVIGTEDIQQQIIKAYSSQTLNILEIQNSNAVAKNYVSADFSQALLTQTTVNNAVKNSLNLYAEVSTLATGGAAGFGVGIVLGAETATDGTNQQQAYIKSSWVDATNATRKAKLTLSAYDTAERAGLEVEANGTVPLINLLGNTYLPADSRKVYWGGGNDLSVYYDGTGAYIKADEVAASDLHIACGTDKTLVLDESVWDDIQFPPSSGRIPVANAPTWESLTANTSAFAFSVDDYIDLQTDEPPHGWSEGTSGSVHVHFAIKTAQNTGANRYAKFTVWVAIADVDGIWSEIGPFTSEQTIATGSGALKHFLLTLGTATFLGYHLGMQIKARVKRIAATGGTEYADDVYITQVGIHVEKVRIGSRSISAA